MRLKQLVLALALCAVMTPFAARASVILNYVVTPLNATTSRYTYYLSGFTFQADQELDILFYPDLYGMISNGVAGPGFAVALYPPNVPVPGPGYFTAYALSDQVSSTSQFSVDFTFIGTGAPGSQPFEILDANFQTLESGMTILRDASEVPEPGFGAIAGLFASACGWLASKRRRRPAV